MSNETEAWFSPDTPQPVLITGQFAPLIEVREDGYWRIAPEDSGVTVTIEDDAEELPS